MRYCSDTWFLLSLFARDKKAEAILEDSRNGKDEIIIPIVVFAEATKKLLQQGISQQKVSSFFEMVESSENVRLLYLDKINAGEAARLSLTYNVPLIDSFVAATCKLSNCDILLSADTDYRPLIKRGYLKAQSW